MVEPIKRVEAAGSSDSARLWRPMLLAILVGTALLLVLRFDLGGRLDALRDWIADLGPLGPVVFTALYIVAVVAAIPGSALTVTAGALFGSALGVVLVSFGSTVGAGLAFLIARYFARDATAAWLARSDRFRRLDEMTERHGAIIVALTRLVPVFPFNLLNYGFGLTRVRFWTYLFWSWLCMLPATVIYVAGGDAVSRGLSEGRIPRGPVLVLVVGVLVLIPILRLARRRLKSTTPPRG